MKKIIVLLVVCFAIAGCGDMEKMYDSANYESLTNERGDIELYSGGKLIKSYTNIEIIYSSSDTFALWMKTKDGQKVYWQGEAMITLK